MVGGVRFFLQWGYNCVQTSSGSHSAFYVVCTGVRLAGIWSWLSAKFQTDSERNLAFRSLCTSSCHSPSAQGTITSCSLNVQNESTLLTACLSVCLCAYFISETIQQDFMMYGICGSTEKIGWGIKFGPFWSSSDYTLYVAQIEGS
jgi:hypothetical protein